MNKCVIVVDNRNILNVEDRSEIELYDNVLDLCGWVARSSLRSWCRASFID